jgi:EmrB/QacA subfamily drug resistance transporter
MTTAPATKVPEATLGPAQRWWILAAVECGNFAVYMDGFIVTLALPAMNRHFGVDIHEIKWVMIAYLATLTVALLFAGRLADLLGRRSVTIVGMALLTVGAVLCALAPTLPALIAFRVMQGLGGALVLANVLAQITATFPPQERRRAMGVNATVLALGQVTGLVLGGFLIGTMGWRSNFAVIGVVSAVGLVLDLTVPRSGAVGTHSSMDWWGALLSVPVIGAPFLLVECLSANLGGPAVGALIAASLIFLALFVIVERCSARPLLDLRVFRARTFTCGSAAAAIYFVAATACYFLLPLYAQTVLGLAPLTAGLLVVPLSVGLTATSQLVGHFSSRFSARMLCTAGLLCTSSAVFALSMIGPEASNAGIIGSVVLIGIGGGLFHPPNNTNVLSQVPHEYLGAASGFFTMARNFGQAIGVSLAAAILSHGLHSGGVAGLAPGSGAVADGPYLTAYVESQAMAYRVAAALGLVGALLSALRGPDAQHSPSTPIELPGKGKVLTDASPHQRAETVT